MILEGGLFVSISSSLHLTQPWHRFRRPRRQSIYSCFLELRKIYVVDEEKKKTTAPQGLNLVSMRTSEQQQHPSKWTGCCEKREGGIYTEREAHHWDQHRLGTNSSVLPPCCAQLSTWCTLLTKAAGRSLMGQSCVPHTSVSPAHHSQFIDASYQHFFSHFHFYLCYMVLGLRGALHHLFGSLILLRSFHSSTQTDLASFAAHCTGNWGLWIKPGLLLSRSTRSFTRQACSVWES